MAAPENTHNPRAPTQRRGGVRGQRQHVPPMAAHPEPDPSRDGPIARGHPASPCRARGVRPHLHSAIPRAGSRESDPRMDASSQPFRALGRTRSHATRTHPTSCSALRGTRPRTRATCMDSRENADTSHPPAFSQNHHHAIGTTEPRWRPPDVETRIDGPRSRNPAQGSKSVERTRHEREHPHFPQEPSPGSTTSRTHPRTIRNDADIHPDPRCPRHVGSHRICPHAVRTRPPSRSAFRQAGMDAPENTHNPRAPTQRRGGVRGQRQHVPPMAAHPEPNHSRDGPIARANTQPGQAITTHPHAT